MPATKVHKKANGSLQNSHSIKKQQRESSGLPAYLPPPSADLSLDPLEYRFPIKLALIYGPLVFLAIWIFLAASLRTNQEEYWKVRPQYLIRLAQESMRASAEGEWYIAMPLSLMCSLCYYMEYVVAAVAEFLGTWFSRTTVTSLMPLFLFMNLFELGSSVRMMRRCPGATVESYIQYGIGVLFFGIAQRISLELAIVDFNKRALALLAKLEELQGKKK